jgi:predicted nucleic acid-binding protein
VPTAFVDTGAWIALMVPRDQYHQRATTFFRSIARNTRLVTSNYVLSEAFTWLRYHNASTPRRSFATRLRRPSASGY